MAKSTDAYKDGDIIFREGETSDRAFEIITGQVEIAKTGRGGEVHLARLDPGEVFGEMGILDHGSRSATAKAVGSVRLRVINREEFLASMKDKPEAALDMMGKLARRLREADEMLAGGAKKNGGEDGAAEVSPAQEAKPGPGLAMPGFINRLVDKVSDRSESIQVRVARLTGEEPEINTRHVINALAKRPGVRARALGETLALDGNGEMMEQLTVAANTARHWLVDKQADILIWGHVPPPGISLHLRFVSLATWDEDKPGSFDLTTDLSLPAEFGPEFADFLYAVTVAATVPQTEDMQSQIAAVLPPALESAQAALAMVPSELTTREQASLHMCNANALALAAAAPDCWPLFEQAAGAYHQALAGFTETESPLDWAITQKHLGGVLQSTAEHSDNHAILGDAAKAFRSALSVLNREDYPREWAALQNRLGLALYRLDFDGSDTEILKQALAAFQNALQVYTRSDAPKRWADVTANFAQVAQVLGRQLKNPEAVEAAVNACRSVLEVRKKGESPMLWAATQNNLGSALFMLSTLTRNTEPIEQAAEAFGLALGVYEARDAQRMAAVTRKNLEHVNQLLASHGPQDRGRKDWKPDGGGPDLEPAPDLTDAEESED